jgi:hypothetical protein
VWQGERRVDPTFRLTRRHLIVILRALWGLVIASVVVSGPLYFTDRCCCAPCRPFTASSQLAEKREAGDHSASLESELEAITPGGYFQWLGKKFPGATVAWAAALLLSMALYRRIVGLDVRSGVRPKFGRSVALSVLSEVFITERGVEQTVRVVVRTSVVVLWMTAAAGGVASAALSPGEVTGARAVTPPCAIRAQTGEPCPTCGLTRSLVTFFEGDVGGAYALHPLGVVLGLGAVVMLVGAPLAIARRRRREARPAPGPRGR